MSFVAEDSVGLACACLTIGQEGGIMAIKDSLDKMAAVLVKIFLVAGVHDMIESEYFLLVVLPLDVY